MKHGRCGGGGGQKTQHGNGTHMSDDHLARARRTNHETDRRLKNKATTRPCVASENSSTSVLSFRALVLRHWNECR